VGISIGWFESGIGVIMVRRGVVRGTRGGEVVKVWDIYQ